MTSWTEFLTSQHLPQNTFILRRPGVTNFADIIAIVTMFIKSSLEKQEQFKELECMYQNAIYICIF